jgi:hypothetical protein
VLVLRHRQTRSSSSMTMAEVPRDPAESSSEGITHTENDGKASALLAVILGVIVASVVPVLVGLFFIGSIRVLRPALGRRSWQWLRPPGAGARADPEHVSRLTTIWAVALIGIGLLQFVGAAVDGLSVLDPVGLAMRSALAVLCGALLYGVQAVRYGRTRSTNPV